MDSQYASRTETVHFLKWDFDILTLSVNGNLELEPASDDDTHHLPFLSMDRTLWISTVVFWQGLYLYMYIKAIQVNALQLL